MAIASKMDCRFLQHLSWVRLHHWMLAPRAEIASDEGQLLTRSEVLILAYFVSMVVGAVVGIPTFLILRSAVKSVWRRILLTGAVLGVVAATLLWFGTTGGRSIVLWALPLGVLSAAALGAVWHLLSRRSAVVTQSGRLNVRSPEGIL